MIQAILFDLDDLMVNSAPLHIEASRRVFKRIGVDITELPYDEVVGYFGKRVSEIIELIAGYFKLEDKIDINDLIKEREKIFLEIIQKDLEPMPGLFELIELLRPLDIRKVVASSGTKIYIKEVLKKFELEDFFEEIVSGDMVEKGKPDPEVFLKAAEIIGIDPSKCLVLEDSTHGIEAAKKAGMFCVGVDNQLSPYKQDLSLADKAVDSLDKIDMKLLKSFTT